MMSDNESKFTVYADGKAVGNLLQGDFDDIEAAARVKVALLYKQVTNWGLVIVNALTVMVREVPQIAFCGFVFFALASPEKMVILSDYLHNNAIDLVVHDALDRLITIWFVIWLLRCIVTKNLPGYRNLYREEIHSKIRNLFDLHPKSNIRLEV